MMAMPQTLKSNEREEAEITQHFVQLHGILQNLEEKLLSQVREQRNYSSKNLERIQGQLKEYHEKLESAIVIASSAKDNIEWVNLVEVTQCLEKLVDVPCHLIEDPTPQNQKIKFTVDKTIIDHLKEHCQLQVPPVHGFRLISTNHLPEDYDIEPLIQEPLTPRSLGGPIFPQRSTTPLSDTILPPERIEDTVLTEGSSISVRAMEVVDPFLFYVQHKSSQSKMQELERGLATIANTSAFVPPEVMLNKMFLVQTAKGKDWYRGRIIDIIPGTNRFKVFFIDNGITEENVSISELRCIPPQYATLPAMALKCALIDIVPKDGEWRKNAIKTFTNLLKNADSLTMYVGTICGDNYYVKLSVMVEQTRSDVGDTLVNLKYASRTSPHQLMRMNPNSVRKYYKDHLRIDKYEEVQVLCIESPSCIYVKKINENNTHFIKKLRREMTDEYEQNLSIGYITAPEKGLPCAARGVDGYWYRGIICEVISKDTLKIFFVDYGYTLDYSVDTIKILRDKYMSIRTQAIKVSLSKIVPPAAECDTWSLAASQFITNCVSEVNHRVKLIAFENLDDFYSVTIYVNKNKNLASLLVKKKLARYTGPGGPNKFPSKKFNRKEKKENPMELLSYDMEFTELRESDPLKENQDPFKVCVLVHQIVSPDCIYVANARSQQSNAELMLQMQDFYNSYHSSLREKWDSGTICAVYSAKDKAFYRAKIVNVKSLEEVTVFFYDIGIEDTVPAKDIQALHPRFSQISAFIFKVKLAGILPCGGSAIWPSHSTQKLQDIINENQHSNFYISKSENREDSTIPVELWIRQAKMDGPLAPTRIEINSVNRMLVEEGVALPIKDYAMKRDKILAIELERQLRKRTKAMMHYEANIKWYKNDDNLDDCVEVDVNESIPNIWQRSNEISSEDEDSSSECTSNDNALRPKLSCWKPAEPILADHFLASATYLDYHCVIYLHSKQENENTIKLIGQTLEKKFKHCKTETRDGEWEPNDLCIAQYHGDNKWYRAKVLRTLENDMIEVQFVDYGNVEELEIVKLKKKDTLNHIPIQCTKAKIHRLIPNNDTGKFEEKDLDKIHGVLIDTVFEVTVLERQDEFLLISITLLPNSKRKEKCDLITYIVNEYNVDLKPDFDDDIENNTCSTSDKSSSIVAGAKSGTEIDNNIKLDDSIVTDNPLLMEEEANTDSQSLSWNNAKKHFVTSTPHSPLSAENLVTYNTIEVPENLSKIEITLSAYGTCSWAQIQENLHCRELNEYYTAYQGVLEDMQTNACNQPLIKYLVPNTPCCAIFEEKWYRCIINEVTPQQKKKHVLVKWVYVDFGNEEIRDIHIKKHNFRCLKDEWLAVPMMALKFDVWNVKENSDVDRNKIVNQMDNKTVLAEIKKKVDDIFYIELFENKESELITPLS